MMQSSRDGKYSVISSLQFVIRVYKSGPSEEMENPRQKEKGKHTQETRRPEQKEGRRMEYEYRIVRDGLRQNNNRWRTATNRQAKQGGVLGGWEGIQLPTAARASLIGRSGQLVQHCHADTRAAGSEREAGRGARRHRHAIERR